ncbi:MAG: hypothetical protein KUG75_12850 [Pseudomonadales bacterium]|nr:hypothetical protein [Pseudomonadales bacterium]
MKYRPTSMYVLVFMLMQIVSNFSMALDMRQSAGQPKSMSVVSVASFAASRSTTISTVANQAQPGMDAAAHHAMKKDCAKCIEGNCCLFASCPTLPMKMKTSGVNLGVQLFRPIIAGLIQSQFSDNLYRPPIS